MRKQYYTQAHIDKATKWKNWFMENGQQSEHAEKGLKAVEKLYGKVIKGIAVCKEHYNSMNKAQRNRVLRGTNLILKEIDIDLERIERHERMKELIAENSAK